MPASSDGRSRLDLEMFSDRELWEYLKRRLEPKYNWEPYLVGRAAVRISGILTQEQKDIELLIASKTEALAAFEQECRQLQSKGKADYFRAAGEFAAWKARILGFKRLVDRRTSEARRAAKVAQRELTEFEEGRRRNLDRETLRQLALAVYRHRAAQLAAGVPIAPADAALWDSLEGLTVALGETHASLMDMIERGHWTEGWRR